MIDQQKVTVEHVHVHSGGWAVVGLVEPAGGAPIARNWRIDAMQRKLAMHSHEMWCPLLDHRTAVPERSDGERLVPDARGNKPRCSEG
jgi:hypothetical protein